MPRWRRKRPQKRSPNRWPKLVGRGVRSSATRTLLAKIADGSNLTLDPDLDSYYVMDVISTKVPEFVDRLGTLLALARVGGAGPAFSDDEKAALMIQLGQLRAESAGAIDSLESAEKGNPDDQVRRNLDALAKSFSGIAH